MIHRRYHIRGGAKTTAGGTVRASIGWYKLDGIPLACEGDPVDCSACGTTGTIQCVMPRIPDKLDGREIALSDDLCICQCNPAPKLIADQTIKLQLIMTADEPAEDPEQPERPASIYDERPRLVAPLVAGLPYHIETPDGRVFSGRTGDDGLLPRVITEGEAEYAVFWGDEALSRATA
jgi:uncharacterized Zn-binding protein involved in type VI secretion